jgi:hypothetical protein
MNEKKVRARSPGNPADAQMVRDAHDELSVSQPTIGALLGIHQPAVSDVEHQKRGLTPTQREELRGVLAVHRATVLLGGGLNVWGRCTWKDEDPGPDKPEHQREAAVRHVRNCHVCLHKAIVLNVP